MKLYLLDEDKIIKFKLPQKKEGSFLFTYKAGNIENNLNVDSEENEWKLKSNGNINIMVNNEIVDTLILEEYRFMYLANVLQNKYIPLYCMPTYDKLAKNYFTQEQINIGKNPNCQITYNQNDINTNHAVIQHQNQKWYITPLSNKSNIYVNDYIIIQPKELEIGDIIFISGLKIIWMNNFIKINNPNNRVEVKLKEYNQEYITENNTYTPVSEAESAIELYNENDYFSQTPRIKSKIETETIKIDTPPENQNKEEEIPILLTVGTSITLLASAFTSIYNIIYGINSQTRTLASFIPNIIMCIAMLTGSLVLPIIIRKYQKKQRIKKEAKRQEKYKKYLEDKEKEIQLVLKKQKSILYENNISIDECINAINTQNNNMWNRKITEEDFIKIRLGIGQTNSKINIESPEEHFTLEEDELYKKACEIKEKYKILEEIPITLSLLENNKLALIKNSTFQDDYIKNLILQLITLHSAIDLKLIILTTKEKEKNWNYAKYLPHCFSENKETRLYATNIEEYKIINQYIEQEITSRKENTPETQTDKTNQLIENTPYYIVITDDYKNIKQISSIEKLLKQESNLGFSLLIIDTDMKNLPPECKKFIYINEDESAILNETLSKESMIKFKPEYKKVDMRKISKVLSNIPIKIKAIEQELPTAISFLEMYNVGKIEQLNITNRWSTSNSTLSLSTPIGIHENQELFKLDLHEKYDGPHGLIAGSTGSGKSEFIITYVLSMAINYHPEDVQFVLIDYKGGGLAGAFENREANISIPHLAGTITNLDTATMNRTLVSIESEIKRRQEKFNKVREQLGESTMDIYKYQKLYKEGQIKEPISHLFIICDEFAELKAQQPDFMQQLISISRIGRSLGVHLILATQKPAGVVNDQIWSNSKFKVCLKVQTKADSMEMIKTPVASSIKETGRFYLQVGYDEYFDIGQSAWSGAKYQPTERIVKKLDDAITFIGNTGNNIRTINNQVKMEMIEENGDQLTNIVKYLNYLAQKENIKRNNLWLPPLQSEIYINDLIRKYNYQKTNEISAIIGEYDAPSMQQQGLLTLNMLNNTLIYGSANSGKENLIETIIYSLSLFYTPTDINIYIGDFGSETLKQFKKLPHVADIFTIEELEKINNLVKFLEQEIDRRKKEYADYGGSFTDYIKYSNQKDELILVILNNIETYKETYPRQEEIFNTLIRESSKYGIIFIISTAQTSAIRIRETGYFQNKICLKMPNETDYRDLLNAPRGLTPANYFGRGIIGTQQYILEFQTALIYQRENINGYIKDYIQKSKEKYNIKLKPIPVLPKIVYTDDVLFELKGLNCVPIGIEKTTLEVYVYDFIKTKITPIISNKLENHIYFLYALTNIISKIDKTKIKIIDMLGIYEAIYHNTVVYKKDFDSVILSIYQEMHTEKDYTQVCIFVGIGEILNKVSKQNQIYIEKIFSEIKNSKDIFIISENYESIKNIQTEPWYNNNVDNTYGIWLGEGIATQTALSVTTLTMDDKKQIFPCISFPIYKGTHMIIKYVVDGVEQENEE